MATTKIWAIKDSLKRVINYAENPEKTIFSSLEQVLKYAENESKTNLETDEKMIQEILQKRFCITHFITNKDI